MDKEVLKKMISELEDNNERVENDLTQSKERYNELKTRYEVLMNVRNSSGDPVKKNITELFSLDELEKNVEQFKKSADNMQIERDKKVNANNKVIQYIKNNILNPN